MPDLTTIDVDSIITNPRVVERQIPVTDDSDEAWHYTGYFAIVDTPDPNGPDIIVSSPTYLDRADATAWVDHLRMGALAALRAIGAD